MKKYNVVEHSLEFRTNKDESWTSEEIKQAFEDVATLEPYTLATFDTEEEAEKYLDNCEPGWSKSKTNTGYVLTGRVHGIDIEDTEDDIYFRCGKYKFGEYVEEQ